MPLKFKTKKIRSSLSCTLPAPIKGLNVRDSLADMDSQYAITMDNYIPSDTKVSLRPGYVEYAKLDKKVCTLAEYKSGNSSKFIAVAGGKFYNVSSSSDIYEFADVNVSESYCRTQQYKNYLYFVNGVDIPKVYYVDDDGIEHIQDWGFTGSSSASQLRISNVSVSKQRLWFVERGTLKVWYPVEAGNIAGELNYFDFSEISRFGGELVAVANWTQDGGQGIDDLTVFITSEGEALVYTGSDINNATSWELKGSYKISRPIGYNCLIPFQGDIVIITEEGYVPLSKALPASQTNSSSYAFSDIIRGLVLDRTAKNFNKQGWQGLIYHRGGYAIFNVPVSNQFEQHICNLNTGAWCRFTNIRSLCWGEYNRRVYFGSEDGIYLFDEGYSDNGTKICGVAEQAYSNLGTDKLKKIQLLNPRTRSSSNYSLVIYTNMDMEKRSVEYVENINNTGIIKWNTVKWSETSNSSGPKWETSARNLIKSQWIANSSTGHKASIVFKTNTKGNVIEWYETGILFEVGDGVL